MKKMVIGHQKVRLMFCCWSFQILNKFDADLVGFFDENWGRVCQTNPAKCDQVAINSAL